MSGDRAERRSSLAVGTRVWAPNPYDAATAPPGSAFAASEARGHPVWVPCRVIEDRSGKVVARSLCRPETETEVAPSSLLPCNPRLGVPDMTQFPQLHDAALLQNLERRFADGHIYTAAGPMLLVVNPYAELRGWHGDPSMPLYDTRVMERYYAQSHLLANTGEDALPPHIFAVADGAYQQVVSDQRSQSVVISGESGSGKTETTKHVLRYLARVSRFRTLKSKPGGRRRRPSISSMPQDTLRVSDAPDAPFSVEDLLLQSNPILEAFGNAKTVRNDNSSRFGKLIKVHVDEGGRIAGGAVSHYLLEKSRLCRQGPGERGFHIFYQIFSGPDADTRARLGLSAPADFTFLAAAPGDGDDDREGDQGWREVANALSHVGIDQRTLEALVGLLAALLHLGNCRFSGEDSSTCVTSDALERAASLLGVAAPALEHMLCTKRVRNAEAALRPHEARAALEAVAKTVYGNLFSWLVNAVNRAMGRSAQVERGGDSGSGGSGDGLSFVGILDIFGFEVFDTNSFEQLCINYANEKLHQLFTWHVFREEERVYKEEGIDYTSVSFQDNQAVIDLIERKPNGLLSILDEACLFPNSTPSSFISKLHHQHKHTPEVGDPPRLQRNAFVVRHSAADVTYDASNFIVKNKDRVPEGVVDALAQSEVPLVAEIFRELNQQQQQQPPSQRGGRGSRPTRGGSASSRSFLGANAFLGSKFKADMGSLVATLKATQMHFVRCMKPNEEKRARFFEPRVVLHQLRYLGVLDGIRIRRSGFGHRVEFAEFYPRYVILLPHLLASAGLHPEGGPARQRELCGALVDGLWPRLTGVGDAPQGKMVQMGSTRVFLKEYVIAALETLREEQLRTMDRGAARLQAHWRGRVARRRLQRLRGGVVALQAQWRGWAARWHRRERSRAARALQRTARGWLARRQAADRAWALRTLQRAVRRWLALRRWVQSRRGLYLLHWMARGYLLRVHMMRTLRAAVTIQRATRRFLVRVREHYATVYGAQLMQALWRGCRARRRMPGIMNFIRARRHERAQAAHAARLGAAWRGTLVRRRFARLRAAAVTLQRRQHTRLQRRGFLRVRRAAVTLQSATRMWLARATMRRQLTQRMVEEAEWRMSMLREREALGLARIGARMEQAAFWNAAAMQAAQRGREARIAQLVDVDVLQDWPEALGDGLADTIEAAQAAAERRGRNLVDVSLGATHGAALDDEGSLLVWGLGDYGQHGLGARTGAVTKPRHLPLRAPGAAPRAPPLAVLAVACGEEHTLAVAGDGLVFAWGSNARGQLGLGDQRSRAHPHHVSAIRRPVRAVSCGAAHSAALLRVGSVFCWGARECVGVAAEKDSVNCGAPLHSGIAVAGERSRGPPATPIRAAGRGARGAAFKGAQEEAKVAYAAMRSRGRVDATLPVGLRCLASHKMYTISCGSAFTLCCERRGRAFAWGLGPQGELGQGHGVTQCPEPRPIQCGVALTSVAAGSRHAAAISCVGQLFMWGGNSAGQLGLGHAERAGWRPTQVQTLRGEEVVDVSCGWRHTLAVTRTRRVFGWGRIGCTAELGLDEADTSAANAAAGALYTDGMLGRMNLSVREPREVVYTQRLGRVPDTVVCPRSRSVAAAFIRFRQAPADVIHSTWQDDGGAVARSGMLSAADLLLLEPEAMDAAERAAAARRKRKKGHASRPHSPSTATATSSTHEGSSLSAMAQPTRRDVLRQLQRAMPGFGGTLGRGGDENRSVGTTSTLRTSTTHGGHELSARGRAEQGATQAGGVGDILQHLATADTSSLSDEQLRRMVHTVHQHLHEAAEAQHEDGDESAPAPAPRSTSGGGGGGLVSEGSSELARSRPRAPARVAASHLGDDDKDEGAEVLGAQPALAVSQRTGADVRARRRASSRGRRAPLADPPRPGSHVHAQGWNSSHASRRARTPGWTRPKGDAEASFRMAVRANSKAILTVTRPALARFDSVHAAAADSSMPEASVTAFEQVAKQEAEARAKAEEEEASERERASARARAASRERSTGGRRADIDSLFSPKLCVETARGKAPAPTAAPATDAGKGGAAPRAASAPRSDRMLHAFRKRHAAQRKGAPVLSPSRDCVVEGMVSEEIWREGGGLVGEEARRRETARKEVDEQRQQVRRTPSLARNTDALYAAARASALGAGVGETSPEARAAAAADAHWAQQVRTSSGRGGPRSASTAARARTVLQRATRRLSHVRLFGNSLLAAVNEKEEKGSVAAPSSSAAGSTVAPARAARAERRSSLSSRSAASRGRGTGAKRGAEEEQAEAVLAGALEVMRQSRQAAEEELEAGGGNASTAFGASPRGPRPRGKRRSSLYEPTQASLARRTVDEDGARLQSAFREDMAGTSPTQVAFQASLRGGGASPRMKPSSGAGKQGPDSPRSDASTGRTRQRPEKGSPRSRGSPQSRPQLRRPSSSGAILSRQLDHKLGPRGARGADYPSNGPLRESIRRARHDREQRERGQPVQGTSRRGGFGKREANGVSQGVGVASSSSPAANGVLDVDLDSLLSDIRHQVTADSDRLWQDTQ